MKNENELVTDSATAEVATASGATTLQAIVQAEAAAAAAPAAGANFMFMLIFDSHFSLSFFNSTLIFACGV